MNTNSISNISLCNELMNTHFNVLRFDVIWFWLFIINSDDDGDDDGDDDLCLFEDKVELELELEIENFFDVFEFSK